MAIYQEDDDLDLERELEEIENHKQNMRNDFAGIDERSHRIRKQLKKRQLDPLVARAIDLAQNLGHALGANEALGNKVKNLNKRIAVRDEKIFEWSHHDDWKARAETAEAKLARRRKR